MTILSSDLFQRPDQSGLGTASDGETWNLIDGTPTLSISSNEGVATGYGGEAKLILGSHTVADVDLRVRVSMSNSTNDDAGLYLRFVDTNNWYRFYIFANQMQLSKKVSGGFTSLANPSFTVASNTFYQVRFAAAGTWLLCKAWPDSTTEPLEWDIALQDSDLASGGYGINVSANSTDIVKVDSFSATTFALPTPIANPYGTSLDAEATPNGTGNLFSNQNLVGGMLDSNTSIARYQINWWGIERAVQTTSSTAVGSAGSHTITLAAKPANFVNGVAVLVDSNASGVQETVTITANTSTTITATFANVHSGTYPVAVIPQAGDTPASSGSPARVAAYDWSLVDDYVNTCQLYGFLPMFTLQNAPPWHQEINVCDGVTPIVSPTDTPAFLTALLTRYPTGTFYAIEAANEGYNSYPPCSALFSTQMLPLLQGLRPVINAHSPATLLLCPPMLDRVSADVTNWFTYFYAAGCHRYVDVLNYHYYNTTFGPDQASVGYDTYTQQWQHIHAVQVANNDAARPLWLTEFGWDDTIIGDDTEALYIASLLASARTSGVVKEVIFYGLGSITPIQMGAQNFTLPDYLVWKNFIASYPSWTPPSIPVYDISGRKMTAQTSSSGVTPGQAGAIGASADTAMLFDGIRGNILLPAAVNTANWPALTAECWMKLSNTTFAQTAFIVANDAPLLTNLGFNLAVTKNTVIFRIGTGSGYYEINQAYTWVAGTWYHLAAVFSGTVLTVYLNGSPISSTAVASALVAQTTNVVNIASKPGSTANNFPGTLQHLALYRAALSAARIQAHYQQGLSAAFYGAGIYGTSTYA